MEIRLDGDVENFIASLERQTIARVLRTIDLLEQFGNRLGMPHSRKMTGPIFELRIRGRQEVRIFYVFQKDTAYLLHGFVKKSQKTPQKELNQAMRRYNDLT